MTAVLSAPASGEPRRAEKREPWRSRLQPLAGPGGWWATLAVGLLAGLLRFIRLDIPFNGGMNGKIFDELYYVCDAVGLLDAGVELVVEGDGDCTPTGEGGAYVVHPPLGKWLIAIGIKIFGEDPFGWRFASAVVGTLSVILIVRAGRRMTGSTLLGVLAGLVLSLDGLHLVQSRIATLDIFLMFWVVAAFTALLIDRDVLRARLAGLPPDALVGWGPRLGVRRWQVVAGLCLGAAIATKWSAIYYLGVLVVLAVVFEVGARRSAGLRAPVRATLARSGPMLAGLLVLLPFAVYVMSWTGWFVSDVGFYRNWASEPGGGWSDQDAPLASVLGLLPDGVQSWLWYHREILRFHEGLSSPHPYQSHALGWLVLARPVSYYYPPDIGPGEYGCDAAACAREVLALGNPVIWWAGLAVLVACLWLWAAKRDWRAGTLVVLWLTAILPWIPNDLNERTMFLFYALPAVPFMALATALVAGWALGGPGATAQRRRYGGLAVGSYLVLVVLAFMWFYPVWTAQTIPLDAWRDRMWFGSWI